MQKFTTKDGYLTFYAMCCGYIETNQEFRTERKVVMRLMNPEINLFLISNLVNRSNIYVDSGIGQARKEFNKQCKFAGTKRTINL